MITKITYPDGEVLELDFDEKNGGHSYTVLPSNPRFGKKAGVTTALSVLNKPFLIQWSAKMACQSIRDNCIVITSGDDEPYYQVTEGDLGVAKKAHSTYKDSRADQGTQLHDLIERHIRGDEPVISRELEGRYNAFLEWEAKVEPEYLLDLMEKPLYSREWDYCGKPDIPCIIDGKYGILDLKSGKPDAEWNSYRHAYTGRYRAYETHYYQCAAYDVALEDETGRRAEWYSILYLDHTVEDKPVVGQFTTQTVDIWRDQWLATLQLYVARRGLNKANPYELPEATV